MLHLCFLVHATSFRKTGGYSTCQYMLSWLYKARILEVRIGSERMLLFLLTSMVGVGVMYVSICSIIIYGTDPDWFGYFADWISPKSCIVGLSGVLFALKTVIHGVEDPHAPQMFQGLFRTESQYIVWFELIWMQLLFPHQVAFLGHISGIVWGLLYLRYDVERIYLVPAADWLKETRLAMMRALAPQQQHQQQQGRQP